MINDEPWHEAARRDAPKTDSWTPRNYLWLVLIIGVLMLVVVGAIILSGSSAGAAGGCGGG